MHKPAGIKRRIKIDTAEAEKKKAEQVLAQHSRQHRTENKVAKRKTFKDMLGRIDDRLINPVYFVREPDQWVSKSHNLTRQKIDFVRWLYCLYRVPGFMYSLFLEGGKKTGQEYLRRVLIRRNYLSEKEAGMFYNWFIAIAQGKSFSKVVKPHLTAREAHLFLNGKDSLGIMQNYWRAKIIAAGGSERCVNIMLSRLPANGIPVSNFWQDIVKFFPRFDNELDRNNFVDVLDYINHALREAGGRFSFKGRTLNSLIKASNEWHKEQQLAEYGKMECELPSLEIQDWKFHDKFEKVTWQINPILNSKALFNEGKAMKHCVATYTNRCKQGYSFIFSLTRDDGINLLERCLTIEVSKDRSIIQIKGRFNRLSSRKEDSIIRRWARDNNVRD